MGRVGMGVVGVEGHRITCKFEKPQSTTKISSSAHVGQFLDLVVNPCFENVSHNPRACTD